MALNARQRETVKVVSDLARAYGEPAGSVAHLTQVGWRRWIDGYAAAVLDLAGGLAAKEVQEAFDEITEG